MLFVWVFWGVGLFCLCFSLFWFYVVGGGCFLGVFVRFCLVGFFLIVS